MSIFAQNYRTELEIYMNQQYPSVLLEKAVGEFSKLPGIGRKTAMRLVLHLLRQDNATVEAFGNSIITLKHEVKYVIIYPIPTPVRSVRIPPVTLPRFA